MEAEVMAGRLGFVRVTAYSLSLVDPLLPSRCRSERKLGTRALSRCLEVVGRLMVEHHVPFDR